MKYGPHKSSLFDLDYLNVKVTVGEFNGLKPVGIVTSYYSNDAFEKEYWENNEKVKGVLLSKEQNVVYSRLKNDLLHGPVYFFDLKEEKLFEFDYENGNVK